MDVKPKAAPTGQPPYHRSLNMAEIHVPYVHYSDEPRDPDLTLADDLLPYLCNWVCKTASRCRRRCSTWQSPKDKSSLSPPASPTSARSSTSSFAPAPALPEDAHYILFSSSPLNTLLVPRNDPNLALPRYNIARSLESPSRNWVTATVKGGDVLARVEMKLGSSKGCVLYGGRECLLKTFVTGTGSSSLSFYAQDLHPARFSWTRDPSSSDLKCLIHRPSELIPSVAATLRPTVSPREHPSLLVRKEAMDCLDMILLTMLVVESSGQ